MATTTADAVQDIRYLYRLLTARPGALVGLAVLRARLTTPTYGHTADVVTAALLELASHEDVRLWEENDRKRLTPADRGAALRLGGTDRHLLAIA